MNFTTPILFLIFNRPETTKIVFEQIRKIRPEFLYIAADGPRLGNANDIVNCAEVKKIVADIDWPCQVTTLFRSENLGCKIAVSQAITWFFEHVEEGIILEDDTLPDISFFPFCAEMLEKYRTDERVMHVSGFNILKKWRNKRQSYHFSRYGNIWVWATWSRCWSLYDVNIERWREPTIQELILNKFPKVYREDRQKLYDKLFHGEIDTWDYQWTFCRLLHNGLSVIPAKNLTINIGFGLQATHTHSMPEWAPKKSLTLSVPYHYYGDIATDEEFDTNHLKITNRKKISLLKKIERSLYCLSNGLMK